jgi:hypothetical protein
VFFAFRAMVGIGVIIIAAGWVGLWLWWRQKLFDVTCHGRRGTAESDPDSDTRAQVPRRAPAPNTSQQVSDIGGYAGARPEFVRAHHQMTMATAHASGATTRPR